MADPLLALSITDSVGLLSGVLLGLGWILLPGAGIACLVDRVGIDCGNGWNRLGWSLLLAITLLPAVDALLVRWGSLTAMACLHGVLALLALRRPAALLPTLHSWRIAGPLLCLWLFILLFAFVDFPVNGRLNQSMLEFDLVKHAAVTNAIARQGLPFADPFFARPGFVGYYYYFYLWPAAIQWSGGLLVDARMAFAAATFWTGLAFPALLWRIGVDSGLVRRDHAPRFMGLVLLFCFVSGADLLMAGLRFLLIGNIEAQTDWWNTEVGFALHSMVWVPHHMAALIAAWTAMLLLARAAQKMGTDKWLIATAAGLGIATCFGSSVWIMLTIAPVFAAWGVIALSKRNRAPAFAGLVALLAASVQILDLLAFRHDGGSPIGLAVRPFTVVLPEGGGWTLLHLMLLPLNYAMEFGLFAWGTIMWWRTHRMWPRDTVQILLIASTVTALLVASFVRSTIINNDLGWRAMWFAQCAAIIWTALWLHDRPRWLSERALTFKLLLILGIGAVLWDIVGLRFIRPPYAPTSGFSTLFTPRANDDDQRRIYEWAARHLPSHAVIQHDPASRRRVFNFGLYGVQRTGVADRDANLFGASPDAVRHRIALLTPIYTDGLLPGDVRRRAVMAGVDNLLFTSDDPVWRINDAPPVDLPCLIREPLACLVSVKDIVP